MLSWTFRLCDSRTGEDIALLSDLSSVSMSFSLHDPHSLSFTIPSAAPVSSLVRPLLTDVKAFANDVLVQRFRVAPAQRRFGNDSNLSFVCHSYKEVLKQKVLYPTDGAVTNYWAAGTDIAQVGAGIISYGQGTAAGYLRTNGSLGINTSSYTLTGRVTENETHFAPGTTVPDAIDSISHFSNSPDEDDSVEWDIEAVGNDLVYQMYGQYVNSLWVPYRGRSEATFNAYLGSTVLSGSETTDPSQFGTVFIVETARKSEEQRLWVNATGTATAGTYTLTFRGETSVAIAYNANDKTIQGALEAMDTIGVGNVEVNGAPPALYTYIKFTGQLANLPVMQLSLADSVTGSNPTLTTIAGGGGLTATLDNSADSPYGRIERYFQDDRIRTTADALNRVSYLGYTAGVLRPTYDLEINPALWSGPGELWIGDFVNLNLEEHAWSANRSDLRCTNLSFNVGLDGDFTMSISVGWPIPKDLNMRNTVDRLKITEGMWGLYQKLLQDKMTEIDNDSKRTAQEKADYNAIADQANKLGAANNYNAIRRI